MTSVSSYMRGMGTADSAIPLSGERFAIPISLGMSAIHPFRGMFRSMHPQLGMSLMIGLGMSILSGCQSPIRQSPVPSGDSEMVEPIMRYRYMESDTHRIPCSGGCGYEWDAAMSDRDARLCDECASDSGMLESFMGGK